MQRVRLTCDSSEKPMQTSSVRRSRRASRPARSPPSAHATRASFGVALCALKVSLFSLTWLSACVARAVVKKAAPKKKKVAKKKKAAPKKKKATKKKAATKAGVARVPLTLCFFCPDLWAGPFPTPRRLLFAEKEGHQEEGDQEEGTQEEGCQEGDQEEGAEEEGRQESAEEEGRPEEEEGRAQEEGGQEEVEEPQSVVPVAHVPAGPTCMHLFVNIKLYQS